MEGDEVLKTNAGGNPMFGKDLYYISILGTPSDREPWMLQFGGHHLALNLTIAGDRGVLHADPDGSSTRPLHLKWQDGTPAWPGERQSVRPAQLVG